MKILPLALTAIGVAALVMLTSKDKKASAAPFIPGVPNPFDPVNGPVGPVVLEEVVIYGDPTALPSQTNKPVVYRIGDRVRVLTLGHIGVIVDFPSAIDPRYPPVGVQIPNFPYKVFASQDIQHEFPV